MEGEPSASPTASLYCEAILFDLDGVLVDSTAVVERQWEIWASRRGFNASEILAVAHGRRIIETLRIVAPEYATDEEANLLIQAEATDVEGLRIVPGARAMLSGLPPDAWAIVTSGNEPVARLRIRHGRFPLPRVIVTADDVTHGKPAPEPYLRAAHALGVHPDRCLVIEDAPAGIASATAAGMRSVGVTGTFPRESLSGATLVIERLDQLQVQVVESGPARMSVSVRGV